MPTSPAARDDGAELTDTTVHNINFGTLGNIDNGDGLLCWLAIDGNASVFVPSNWDIAINRVGPNNAVRGVLAYSTASGNEGNSVDFGTSSPTTSVHRIWRFDRLDIAPWSTDPPEGSSSTNNQTFIQAPLHNVSWDDGEDNWWVAAYAADDPSSTAIAFPGTAGQSNQFTRAGGGEAIATTELFDRQRDSLSPGVFLMQEAGEDAEQAVAITAAVRPRDLPPQTVQVGAATEDDTAQPVNALIILPPVNVGAASEDDTAQPVGSLVGFPPVQVGAASEDDTAQPVGSLVGFPPVQVGAATETDTAHPVTGIIGERDIDVGAATEIDTGHPVEPLGDTTDAVVETAIELDTAEPVTALSGVAVVAVGEGIEQDRAFGLVGQATEVVVAVEPATETDSPGSITPTGASPKLVPVGTASEDDTAQPVTPVSGGTAVLTIIRTETDATALPVTPGSQGVATAQVLRVDGTDIANPIVPTPGRIIVAVGTATETDAVGSIVPAVGGGQATINVEPATERDIALPVLAPGQTPDVLKIIKGRHAACYVPGHNIVTNQAVRRSARRR